MVVRPTETPAGFRSDVRTESERSPPGFQRYLEYLEYLKGIGPSLSSTH